MIAQGGEEVQVEVQQMFSHRGTFIPEDSGKKSKRRLERMVRLDRERIRRENPALNLVGEEDEDRDEKVGGDMGNTHSEAGEPQAHDTDTSTGGSSSNNQNNRKAGYKYPVSLDSPTGSHSTSSSSMRRLVKYASRPRNLPRFKTWEDFFGTPHGLELPSQATTLHSPNFGGGHQSQKQTQISHH